MHKIIFTLLFISFFITSFSQASATEAIGKVELKLYNSIGQLMQVNTSNVVSGTTNIELGTNKLATGSYRLTVTDKNNQVIENRTIQKL